MKQWHGNILGSPGFPLGRDHAHNDVATEGLNQQVGMETPRPPRIFLLKAKIQLVFST